jgi:hypothetical protein
MDKIRKLSNFGTRCWEDYVEAATVAVNASLNRSINTSPYIFKFGKTPIFDIDAKYKVFQTKYSKKELNEKRNAKFTNYSKSIVKGKITAVNDFEIRDRVLMYREILSDKFKSSWQTGFVVLRKVEPDAYILFKDGKEFRANKSHVKHDFSNGGNGGVVYSNYNSKLSGPILRSRNNRSNGVINSSGTN